MNNNETRGKIEKSKGKIMGDKSEQVKRKIEQVKGMVQEEERLRRKPRTNDGELNVINRILKNVFHPYLKK